MKRFGPLVVLYVVFASLPVSTQAQDADPLVGKVKTAIDRGVRYLKDRLEDRGGEWNWENADGVLAFSQPGGQSAIAFLALLTCGVKPDDPKLQKALPYIRSMNPPRGLIEQKQKVYVTGIQTLILAEMNQTRDFEQIQKNVDWLINARVKSNGKLIGWGYESKDFTADNSNTQYALLGLWAGRQSGAKIPKEIWQEIQDFYIRTQSIDKGRNLGSWSYKPDFPGASSYTMTAAGVCGLHICSLELSRGKQELDPKTGVAAKCGFYDENDALARGMRYLDKNFTFKLQGTSFYNIYGIERVGRLSGDRFIGEHDWYREGCEFLTGVRKDFPSLVQRDDGSWYSSDGHIDSFKISSTSLALLFLAKGRTPILMSKLAYDVEDADKKLEWNRKHHDARNLVDFASRELFKRHPLAWQIYDPRKIDLTDKKTFDDELSSLLQSPIVYITGHKAPVLSARQKELLRRFVEEGGFIMAEACCGSPEFIKGFDQLMKDVFQEKVSPLRPLPPEHPVWTAHSLIKPTDFPQLRGVERGCRTVVMMSPQPLAGFWEEAQYSPEFGRPAIDLGGKSYRLAANIIAYATNLELPQPRLTRAKVTEKTDERKMPRHTLKIAQVKTYGSERIASTAIRNLGGHLKDVYKLDVSQEMDVVSIERKEDLANYKVLYMHGNSKFTYDPEDLENLRFTLLTGGTLLADPCCGKKEFTDAFVEFVGKLFPKDKYPTLKFERIPLDDYLFSEKLNGKAINKVRCRTDKVEGNATELEEIEPFLQGIKIDGRWAVIFSPYDLGCALEKNKSIACRGYSHEDALRIAGAVVLYSLKR
jgi:hypothetical protein